MDITHDRQGPDAAPFVHSGARVDVEERNVRSLHGGYGVVVLAVLMVVGIVLIRSGHAQFLVLPVLAFVLVLGSLVIIQPGETRVVQFFGRYVGTVRRPGLSWVAPLSTRRKISVRVRNFETRHLRVNDAEGNPVEIAAIVVWQVADTAKAVYAVDDYLDFVSVQAESALRQIATTYPYDTSGEKETSLRGSTELVASELSHEMTARVALAGIEVVEVRISHLAYAPEIAQAMLRRQQAGAVVEARSRIVEGAVGMVEMALDRLNESDYVTLDDERRAAMVSNLMVVLCSDQPTAPVVNTGTLYSS
ncbi:SPFH domain-containing protein [Specibacter cremeus]|uniref:SPFH domain-containing protein n=1 Tax=Specibacter cremeus TaxID=1629051 RepID=UPI000F7939D1|nr:SPFH domain-containing protein [Specibacter cremeus]